MKTSLRLLVIVLALPAIGKAGAAPPAAVAGVPLGIPAFAKVYGDGKVVNFAWWSVKGATEYQLLRSSDPQGASTAVAVVPMGTLGATDQHPQSTGMYYQLVAVGPDGARAASAWMLVNTPTVTGVSASSAGATVTWSTIQPSAVGFEIWRTADPAKPPSRIGAVAKDTTTFIDRQSNGANYYYQVVTVGVGGSRAGSALYPVNAGIGAAPTNSARIAAKSSGPVRALPQTGAAAPAVQTLPQSGSPLSQSALNTGSAPTSASQSCQDLCVSQVTATTLKVQWSAYQGAGASNATRYTITRQAVPPSCTPYSPSCGLGVQSVATVWQGSTLSATAQHLLPGTSYAITVTAVGPGSQVINPISSGSGGGTPAAYSTPQQVLGRPRTILATTAAIVPPQNLHVEWLPHCNYILHVTWDPVPGVGYRVSDNWSEDGAPPYLTCEDGVGSLTSAADPTGTGGIAICLDADADWGTFGPPITSAEVYMHAVSAKDPPSIFTVKSAVPRYLDDGSLPPPDCSATFLGQPITVPANDCTPPEVRSVRSVSINGPVYNLFDSTIDNSACNGWVPVDPTRPDGPFTFKP